jgi:hypothetical protein
MNEVVLAFEAIALQGEVRRPEVRVTRHEDAIWIDLGCPDWQLIQVTADGWTLLDQADVPLIRFAGLGQLPVPKHDPAALPNLRALMNFRTEADLQIAVGWLIAAFFPEGPFAVLALCGDQGQKYNCRDAARVY